MYDSHGPLRRAVLYIPPDRNGLRAHNHHPHPDRVIQ